MDKKTIAYWAFTGFLVLPFGGGGVMDLIQPDNVVEVFENLGYPLYLATILGIAKLLGLLVVLAPGLPRLKEWAYAGFVIDLIGAFLSHLFVGDGIAQLAPPIVVMVPVLLSWWLRPENRRLPSAA